MHTFCLLLVILPVLIVKRIIESILVLIIKIKDKMLQLFVKEEDRKDCIYYVGFYRGDQMLLKCAVNPNGDCLTCSDYCQRKKHGKHS